MTLSIVNFYLCVFISKNSTLEVALDLSWFHPPDTTTPGLPLRVTEVQPWLVRAWCMGGTLYLWKIVTFNTQKYLGIVPVVGGQDQLHGGHLLTNSAHHQHLKYF